LRTFNSLAFAASSASFREREGDLALVQDLLDRMATKPRRLTLTFRKTLQCRSES